MKQSESSILALGLAAAAYSAFGCAPREPEHVPPFGDLTKAVKAEYAAKGFEPPLAGMPRDQKFHSKQQIVASADRRYGARGNPFALFGEEVAFQTGIRFRIILGKLPGYALEVPAPVEETPIELVPEERQPYRRVAGVYFGESIAAIIEMEGGKTYVVMPGMRVGETEWYVESIDPEKVILRRDPKKRPSRVMVRLESAPFFAPGGQPEPGAGAQPGGGQQPPGAGGGRAGAGAGD